MVKTETASIETGCPVIDMGPYCGHSERSKETSDKLKVACALQKCQFKELIQREGA